MSNAISRIESVANASDFCTYVRRATTEELQETERNLQAELAAYDARSIRTQWVDTVKERLTFLSLALSRRFN